MDPHCKNPGDPLDHDLNPLIKGLNSSHLSSNVFASHPLGNHFVFIWLHLYRLLQTKEKYKRTKQHSRNGYRHQARNERRQYSRHCCSRLSSQYYPTVSRGRPSVFRRTSRMWPLKQNVNEVCCFWLGNSFKREVVRRCIGSLRKKGPGVLNEEFATRKNYLKGVEHFPDFRTSSGNRDFENKNGKKNLCISFHYIYTKFTFIQKWLRWVYSLPQNKL